MRQDLHRRDTRFRGERGPDRQQAVLADRAVGRDILLGDRAGAVERGGEAKLRRQIG